MEHVATSALVAFAALFPVVDPIGNVPAFMALTGGMRRERQQQARIATLIAAALLVTFFTLGHYLLSVFHVSLAAVETVGGLVIGFSGWQMVTAHPMARRHEARPGDDDVAFYPMAFPLLAGPGALALALGLTNRHDSYLDFVGWAIGIASICFVSYVFLRLAAPVAQRLGPKGIEVTSRMMGLIVLAIGAELVFNGVALEFGIDVPPQ